MVYGVGVAEFSTRGHRIVGGGGHFVPSVRLKSVGRPLDVQKNVKKIVASHRSNFPLRLSPRIAPNFAESFHIPSCLKFETNF